MFSRRLLLSAALIGSWLVPGASPAGEDSRSEKPTAPSPVEISRGDATSDPLLILLRAPRVRRELALRPQQVESLERAIDEIDGPLWRLRDAQFQSAENSKKAWQCIDQVESALGEILEQDQRARLRQMTVQARGPQALLLADVIHALKLSPSQVKRIAEILDEMRKEAQRPQKESTGKTESGRSQEAGKQLLAQRKKVAAVLSEDQRRRLQRLAGPAYDFSALPRRFVRAPEIRGVEPWINSAPLTLADLRGKVVVFHFFTFGCINCIHNQPAYKDWHDRFSGRDAVVLGIHTPEGEGDRNVDRVRKAIQDQGILYPVAVDNKKQTWTSWSNHTWPAVYLIDKEGYVRYWWYGELNWQGAEGEKLFREKIAELLAEPKVAT
jgi:peroxiredoxin